MVRDPEIGYVPAVREDVALGVSSAAYFAGGLGGVILQNSGIGNLGNLLKMPYQVMEPDTLESDLDCLLTRINKESVLGALIVRAGMIL